MECYSPLRDEVRRIAVNIAKLARLAGTAWIGVARAALGAHRISTA
jgi:hypothetical protein